MTTRTVGVEEGFLLVDRAGSDLSPVGDPVAVEAAAVLEVADYTVRHFASPTAKAA